MSCGSAVRMVLEIRERDAKGHGEIARVGRHLDVHPEALRRHNLNYKTESTIARTADDIQTSA